MARLVLENITKTFDRTQVINGIDLDIPHGEFVVFVGPSGCGKTTVLRMISGLESTTSGRILIGDGDVTYVEPSKRQVAMVFQSYALFPHMTTAENIGFSLRLAKRPKEEIKQRVAEVAQILRIEPLLTRRPAQLSGGQRQRVAIGRAIIRNPEIFLFDEPLSNLDAALRIQMRLEIARLHKRLGATLVYVTHDQTEAMTLANRIVVFNAGRIEQTGTPMELYDNPANLFVAGFIGSPAMNFIPSQLANAGGKVVVKAGTVTLAVEKKLAKTTSREVILGIRPEHLVPSSPKDKDFVARIEIVEELGAESLVYLQNDLTAEPITMRSDPSVRFRPGEEMPIKINRAKMHLFTKDGALL